MQVVHKLMRSIFRGNLYILTLKCQPHEIIKHIQTTSSANCLSLFDHFMGLPLKGLNHSPKDEEN